MHYLGASIDASRNRLVSELPDSPQVSVGCGIQLVDKERLSEVGFFDEDFPLGWGDDGEFHHRVNLSGLKCYSVPQAVAYHAPSRAYSRFYGQIHNRWSLIVQSYALKTIVLLLPALAVYEVAVLALLVRRQAAGEYLKAVRQVLARRKRVLERRQAIQSLRRVGDRDLLHCGPIFVPGHLLQDGFIRAGARLLNRMFSTYWRLIRPVV
jgi:GT2 family glycosyltransferase